MQHNGTISLECREEFMFHTEITQERSERLMLRRTSQMDPDEIGEPEQLLVEDTSNETIQDKKKRLMDFLMSKDDVI